MWRVAPPLHALGNSGYPIHVQLDNSGGFPWAIAASIAATILGVILGEVMAGLRDRRKNAALSAQAARQELRERRNVLRSLRLLVRETELSCRRVELHQFTETDIIDVLAVGEGATSTSLARPLVDRVVSAGQVLNTAWVDAAQSVTDRVGAAVQEYVAAADILVEAIDKAVEQLDTQLRTGGS